MTSNLNSVTGNAVPDMPEHPDAGIVAAKLATDTIDRVARTRMGERISDTRLARGSGLTRQTVAKYLNPNMAGGMMPLGVFLAAQLETGGDPAQALADALATAPAREVA